MPAQRESCNSGISRRRFVEIAGAGCLAGGPMISAAARGLAPVSGITSLNAGGSRQEPNVRRILKSLKIGMVGAGDSLVEKFKVVRDAGFDGIEMNSPGMDPAETRHAIAVSGLPVDGTVCSTHWNVRHTSPDAETRRAALRDLETAIRDTRAVGGSTTLLVAGHGEDGPEEEIWNRAIENISLALPLAAQLGVYIAIENVWNHFMYDHDGDENQSADKFARFVDELNSPWVGMQFDIGNHWKYGDPAAWIRTLGKRIVKLDVKGYSRANRNWAAIGEGDIDWTAVRTALNDIGFSGWAAAEVGGGDVDWLKTVSGQLDSVLYGE